MKVGVGDWVVQDRGDHANPFVAPKFLLRRIAAGPQYQTENGHASAVMWMLDDGQLTDQRWLKRLDLYELLCESASIADRLERCVPVPRKEIEAAVVNAHRWLTVIERSYPQDHQRHDDVRTAHHVLTRLTHAASAWRRLLEHQLPCLATALGWAGVLCAAEKRGLQAARLVVFASRTREDALAAIDSLLSPPKETHEQHDRPPEPGGDEPGPDSDPQVSLRFS